MVICSLGVVLLRDGRLKCMGTWGAAIFSDDTAADVRDTYRSTLESGVSDAEAMHEILQGFGTDDRVVWLALAATQSVLGRLDPLVRDRAVEIIDTGEDLEEWGDAATRDQRARSTALLKLRATLTDQQPARRPIPVKWRHHTDLVVGDVLSIDVGAAPTFWVVVAVESDPAFGTHPWIRRLDPGTLPPTSADDVLDRLRTDEIGPDPAWDEVWALRDRRRTPDWTEVGFSMLPRDPSRSVEGLPRGGYIGITWTELVAHLSMGTNPFRWLNDTIE
jgi:hypothetical protein